MIKIYWDTIRLSEDIIVNDAPVLTVKLLIVVFELNTTIAFSFKTTLELLSGTIPQLQFL